MGRVQALSSGSPAQMFVIPAAGGPPKQLIFDPLQPYEPPPWTAHGRTRHSRLCGAERMAVRGASRSPVGHRGLFRQPCAMHPTRVPARDAPAGFTNPGLHRAFVARRPPPRSPPATRRRATQIARVPDRSDTNAIGSDLAAGPEHRTRSPGVDAHGCRPAVVAARTN